jgi:ABC-type sugar transport system permease subunit
MRSLVFMPVILGVTVSALIWSLVLNIYGPVQAVLGWFGQNSGFFGSPTIALYLCAFVAMWANVGVTVVIFLAGLQAIPDELYEVAAIDGASPGQVFRHITFPLLAPSFTTNTLLGLIGSLQSYQMIYVLTGNRASTKVFSLSVFFTAFGSGHDTAATQGYAATISMVQFVLVAIVAAIALAYLRRREKTL